MAARTIAQRGEMHWALKGSDSCFGVDSVASHCTALEHHSMHSLCYVNPVRKRG